MSLEELERAKTQYVNWDMTNPMFAALSKLGWNLQGKRDWDGVEFHYRIFGHLPEKKGEGLFYCSELPDKGAAKMGEFLELLCAGIALAALEAAKKDAEKQEEK